MFNTTLAVVMMLAGLDFLTSTAAIYFSYKIIIKNYGLEPIGLWATILAWTSILKLGDTGTSSSVIKFISGLDRITDQKKIIDLVRVGFFVNLAQYMVLSMIGGLIGVFFFINSNARSQEFIILYEIGIAIFLLSGISGGLLSVLQGLHKGNKRSIISIGSATLQLILSLMLVPKFGIKGLAMSLLLQNFVLFIVSWVAVCRELGSSRIYPVMKSGYTKEFFKYGLGLQLTNLMSGIVEPILRLLIGRLGGAGSQGLFEVAYKTISVPKNFLFAAAISSLPAVSRIQSQSRNPRATNIELYLTKIYASIGFSIMAFAYLFSEQLSHIWHINKVGEFRSYCTLIGIGFFGQSIGLSSFVSAVARGNFKLLIINNICMILFFGFLGGIFFKHSLPINAVEIWSLGMVIFGASLAINSR